MQNYYIGAIMLTPLQYLVTVTSVLGRIGTKVWTYVA